jgi:hypothetical protein
MKSHADLLSHGRDVQIDFADGILQPLNPGESFSITRLQSYRLLASVLDARRDTVIQNPMFQRIPALPAPPVIRSDQSLQIDLPLPWSRRTDPDAHKEQGK